MIKIKKVSAKEVKRTFVIGNLLKIKNGKKQFLKGVTKKYFEHRLRIAKRKGLKMSEKQLSQFIFDEYPKRLRAFDSSDWYVGEVVPSEVGVWRRAGGLPLKWTNGSLKETAEKIKYAMAHKHKLPKGRAAHTIPNMLKTNVSDLQKEKYLLPIVFKGGTGTNGRWSLKRKMKGDIDDGCMRSITLTVHGAKKIRAYIGYPKKKRGVGRRADAEISV